MDRSGREAANSLNAGIPARTVNTQPQGLCWNSVVSHSFPPETIIHDLSWLIRKSMSTKSGTGKVRTSKPKSIYAPRIISDTIMVQEDFERLHQFLLETESLTEVSDDMRELVEEEWPELVHKLPPKVS